MKKKKNKEEKFICFEGEWCAIIEAKNKEKAERIFKKNLKEHKKNERSKLAY